MRSALKMSLSLRHSVSDIKRHIKEKKRETEMDKVEEITLHHSTRSLFVPLVE